MSNPVERFNQARTVFATECEEFDKTKETWVASLEKHVKSQQKLIAEQMLVINFLAGVARKDETAAEKPETVEKAEAQPDNV